MKYINTQEDKGCPNTNMREYKNIFEKENPNLDFHMKPDAPHYSSKDTRIAYSKWESGK